MNDRPHRVTRKKLEAAAELAKSQGVRVSIGDFVIDPPDAAKSADDEARRAQAKIDAMSGKARA